MSQLITFHPLYQPRIWGGRRLASFPSRELPDNGELIGESWEIVDRDEAQSVVRNGRYQGLTLRQLRELHGREIFGDEVDIERSFPILVKWLDCSERLSLQVHPPATVATQLGGEPKTENWYVADAEEGAVLLAGLRQDANRESLLQALGNNTLETLVQEIPVQAGDSLLVHSGCVHAIGGGNLILEIQQNSDTTYRLYDWGRVGTDGKPRELHIEESLQCIHYGDTPPQKVHAENNPQVIAESAEFRITEWRVKDQNPLSIDADLFPRLGHIVSGSASCTHYADGILCTGTNFLIPAGLSFILHPSKEFTFLLTDRIRF
jgi:mannose-6-phosphate isomerase